MESLNILDELRSLIPALKPEELEQLHCELDASGKAHDPLIVWKERNAIVDGHNRYEYCTRMGYEFTVRRMSFSGIEQAQNFMILHQLGRRNLDPDQAALLRGKLYNARKKAANDGGKGTPKATVYQSDTRSTAETIAKQTGVSAPTVMRDAKFAEAMETLGIGADVMAGKEKRSRKAIIEEAARKANNPTKKAVPAGKKPEAWKNVVAAFKRLDFNGMEKAIKEIDTIWNEQ